MEAKGHIIKDDEGKEWIDLLSGTFRCSLGFGNPVVEEAILKHHQQLQVDPLQGLSAKELSRKLSRLCKRPRHWHYTTNLDKAVELAVMTAIEFRCITTGYCRSRIRTFTGDYHGSSFSLGSLFHHFDNYRRPIGFAEVNPITFQEGKLSQFEVDEVDFDAFIFEPIQIVSGWGPGPEGIDYLTEWCRQHNAFLIANESITSFGRCGFNNFITSQADILISSLSIGQGLPIVAVGFKDEAIDPDFMPECGWPVVNLFNTSVASELISILTCVTPDHCFGRIAREIGSTWFEILNQHFPEEDLRVQGALVHINCKNIKRPEFVEALKEESLIAGSFPPWLVLAPAFTIPLSVMCEVAERVVRVCKRLRGD